MERYGVDKINTEYVSCHILV